MGHRFRRSPESVAPWRIDVDAPAELHAQVMLARTLTGETLADFVRRAVRRLADRELFRRPGAYLWLRPRARVYRLVGGGAEPTAELLAEAAGGERVWPLQRVEPLPAGLGPESERGAWRSGFLCDLSPEDGHDCGLSMRRVLVLAGDVLPRALGRAGGCNRRAVRYADPGPNHGPVSSVKRGPPAPEL
jgi:hypothetical protein